MNTRERIRIILFHEQRKKNAKKKKRKKKKILFFLGWGFFFPCPAPKCCEIERNEISRDDKSMKSLFTSFFTEIRGTFRSGIHHMEEKEEKKDEKKRKRQEEDKEKKNRESKLSFHQTHAIQRALKGEHLFITGGAGTGKSYTIWRIYREMIKKGRVVQITATTGLVATHLCGVTLHHFMGVKLAKESLPTLLQMVKKNPFKVANWKTTQTLIIDEISMMKPYLWEILDFLAREIRGNSLPFGGIQLIVSGDFFQLPPVYQKEDVLYKNMRFVFEHELWKVHFGKQNTIYLEDVFRQNQVDLYSSLNRLRVALPTREDNEFWKKQLKPIPLNQDSEYTILCATNREAEKINFANLKKLCPEQENWKPFKAECTLTEKGKHSSLAKSFLFNMKKNCLARPQVAFTKGARVMLVANLDSSEKLMNGVKGIILDFDEENGFPIICFDVGHEKTIIRTIERFTWSYEVNKKILAKYCQLPLLLAYGITIHKAQGMSLNKMSVNLSNMFECGQGYVALSRVTTLENLCLTGYDPKAFFTHPLVKEYDDSLKKADLT